MWASGFLRGTRTVCVGFESSLRVKTFESFDELFQEVLAIVNPIFRLVLPPLNLPSRPIDGPFTINHNTMYIMFNSNICLISQ
jgi:hypothetical protein